MDETFLSTMQKLGDQFGRVEEDTYMTTGSVIFDAILSSGKGMPQKKFVSLSSPAGVGKSTCALYFLKEPLRQGKVCIYLDVEKGVNMAQLEGIGIKEYLGKNLFVIPLSTYEDAEEVIDKALEQSDLAYIVVDSITQLIAKKMLDRSVEQYDVGTDAQLTSKFLKKYKTKLQASPSKCVFIFINQYRTKIKLTGNTSEGEAGGTALKHNMDIRLCMRSKEKLEKTCDTLEGKTAVPYGCNVDVWAEKNRHNRPFVHAIATVLFGKGISNLAAYRHWFESRKMLTMRGAGFYELKFPGEAEPCCKARGEPALLKEMKKVFPKLVEYVNSNGGFDLVQEKED